MNGHIVGGGAAMPETEELYIVTDTQLAADFEKITCQLHERGGAIRIQCDGHKDMVLLDIEDYFKWFGTTESEMETIRKACRAYQE